MASPPVAAASSHAPDVVEVALATALEAATKAGEWAVVAQLAGELAARRSASAEPALTSELADVVDFADAVARRR